MSIENNPISDLSHDRNPGKELQTFLKQIFPADVAMGSVNFLVEMDEGVKAEGQFITLVYDSCINHIVRRLIITADAIKGMADKIYKENERFYGFVRDLRSYLETHLRTSEDEREVILSLLMSCIENQGKPISRGTKNKIKREAQQSNLGCYICGCELDYQDPRKANYAEFEHVWPNRLGGASTYINVRLACATCNRIKRNYIDASDFHYEQICLAEDVEALERKEQDALVEALAEAEAEIVQLAQVADEARAKAVSIIGNEAVEEAIAATVNLLSARKRKVNIYTEFRREYKIALWAKHDYKCRNCKQDISLIGRLKFRRSDIEDSWHFLNIDGYCESCLSELQS